LVALGGVQAFFFTLSFSRSKARQSAARLKAGPPSAAKRSRCSSSVSSGRSATI
jgi:hypothetical protein